MTSLSLARLLPAAFAGVALCSGIAFAQDAKLPTALTVTAYDTGSSGFNMVVAIGKMMKQKHGSDLRVLPAGNDIARRVDEAVTGLDFCVCSGSHRRQHPLESGGSYHPCRHGHHVR